MEMREWEQSVIAMMIEDEWGEIPASGDKLTEAMPKVLDYIQWLRGRNAD